MTDDTAAIQAAINAAAPSQGTVVIPASANKYMFTNLTLYANMRLLGAGMNLTQLQRFPSATGPAIREKTAAEGNPLGAGGLWVKDLFIDGNGSSGDGLYLGDQVAANQLNFNSGVENVHVRNFPSGIGIRLNQNAASCKYLWSNVNQVGLKTTGGGGAYFGVWAEGNSSYDFQLAGNADSFFHLHCEPAAAGTAVNPIRLEGFQNRLYSPDVALAGNRPEIVYVATGADRNIIYGMDIQANGHTFTHGIYLQAAGYGTGSADVHIPFFICQSNSGGGCSYVFNQSTNNYHKFSGDTLQIGYYGVGIKTHISGTFAWDPPSVAAGAQTTTTVAIGGGAALGDTVTVGFDKDLQGMQLTGYVSSTNNATVVLRNGTAGAIDLAAGNLRVDVWQH